MINFAVFNIKDIIKKFFKCCIIFILIYVFFTFLKVIKISNIVGNTKEKIEEVSQSSFTDTIERTIVLSNGLKENKGVKGKSSNIKKILSSQFILLEDLDEEILDEDMKNEVITQINESNENYELPKENLLTQIIEENNIEAKYTNIYNNVKIKNESKYELSDEMLEPNIEIENKNNILIFHTHTCESYTPTENYNYEMTGMYRTTDLNFTVSRVGDELTNILSLKGYNVVHDTTYHDFPAYSGSYSRSFDTVKNIIEQNEEFGLVIDLHRDAIGSNSNYGPTIKIGEEYAAQLMFVMGTDGGGLEHSNWNENLKRAIKIQEKAEEMYPGLFRPIILRNSRYNQNLAKGACIIEVGATGNSLDECLKSMKFLASIIDNL